MVDPNYFNNLPALLEDDLPVPLPEVGRVQRYISAFYPAWSNWSCQRSVNALAVCPLTGTIWLATGGGVLAWQADGQTFTRYTSEHGLQGNTTHLIIVDANGQVWAAAQNNLQQLVEDHWQIVLTPVLPTEQIGCFALDNTGALWFGTQNGVYAWDQEQSIVIRKFDIATVMPPRALAVVNQDEVWLCNALGLIRYKAGKTDLISRQPTYLALALQERNLWVGSIEGLATVNLDAEEMLPVKHSLRGPTTALLALSDGGLAAAMHKQLVYFNTAGEIELFYDCVNDGEITGLAVDNDACYWVATDQDLIRVITTRQARTWTTRTPPDVIYTDIMAENNQMDDLVRFSNLVQSLAIDSNPSPFSIWMATPSGLFYFKPNTAEGHDIWRAYTFNKTKDIQSLLIDDNTHELWFASWVTGVCRWEPNDKASPMAGLSTPVLLLTRGLHGARWAATMDGLYRSFGDVWEQVLSRNQLPTNNPITAIVQIQPDQLWLGTTAGLLLYNPVYNRLLLPKQNIAEKITALAYDSINARLWAGTDTGLLELQAAGDGWSIANELTVQNSGLAANHITALAVSQSTDNRMLLWLGTSQGLSRYTYDNDQINPNPSQLDNG